MWYWKIKFTYLSQEGLLKVIRILIAEGSYTMDGAIQRAEDFLNSNRYLKELTFSGAHYIYLETILI